MNNRLKVLRAERDWSQGDLAERLEVSRQSVNAIETGRYDPSLPLAFKIAELFGLAIEDIFVSPSREKRPMIRFLARIALSAAMPLMILSPKPSHAAAPAPVRMDHISIETIGSGAPVILIPGLSSPRAVWAGVAPGLAEHHRVIIFQVN